MLKSNQTKINQANGIRFNQIVEKIVKKDVENLNDKNTLEQSSGDNLQAVKNTACDFVVVKPTRKITKKHKKNDENTAKKALKNTEKTLKNIDFDAKNSQKSTEKTLKNIDFDAKNASKNAVNCGSVDGANASKTLKNNCENEGANASKMPLNNGEARSEIANINKKGIIPDLITAEDIADDKAVAEAKIAAQKEAIHRQKLVTANYVWTLICTVYVIISTVVLISKGWIESIAAYVLIGLLVVYILAFAVIVSIDHQNKQKGAKRLSYYKKLLAIFKIFANMMFLAVSAVTLVGVAGNGKNIVEWIVFVLTFVTVSIQLALKISLLVVRLKRKHIGKRYKVQIYSYVNGKEQKKKTSQKISESMYKNDN